MHIFFDERQTTAKTEFMSYVIYMIFITSIYLFLDVPIITMCSNLMFFYILTYNYHAKISQRILSIMLIYFSLMFIELFSIGCSCI